MKPCTRRWRSILLLALLVAALAAVTGALAPVSAAGGLQPAGCGPQIAGGPQPALVLMSAPDWASLKSARAFVEARGGRVTHVFPPGAFIVEATPELAADWLSQSATLQVGIAAVRFDAVDPASFEPWAATAIAIWNQNYWGAGERAPLAPSLDTPFEEPVRMGAPPEQPSAPAAKEAVQAPPYGGSMYDTSEYMIGDVAVALILPESNGISQTKTHTWTLAQVATIQADVQSGLNRYIPYDPNAHVTFIYHFPSAPPAGGVTGTVECNYEAVDYESTCLSEAIRRLGYSTTYQYVNAVRDQYGAQWAYAVLGVNGSGRAYAYLGGPTTVIYNTDLRSGYVIHHETGHIFGAGDEYCPDACASPTSRYGYLSIVNANSRGPGGTLGPGYFGGIGEGVPGVMVSGFGDLNPYARGGIGWRDRDGDGILDELDTLPETTLLTPTAGSRIQVQGVANVTPYRVSSYGIGGVAIDTISSVEYRVNGTAWQPAIATDGAFDESVEEFSIWSTPLPDGVYQLEARAINGAGNIERKWASAPFTVSGSSAADAAPFASLSLRPTFAAYTTPITFDASDSTDLEGGALNFCWDWHGDGACDTSLNASPAVTHTYTVTGTLSPAVHVQDAAGNTAIATATLILASGNTPPMARLSASVGAVWGVVTPTFTFDASATRDGETPADLIQVRWDWDGNGTYDTAYTTTKVITHAYGLTALGRPDGAPRSNEFLVKMQARDAAGQVVTASLVVWANPYDHPPTVTLDLVPSRWHTATALPMGNIAADADVTTTWDGLLEARWDWDDDGNWDTPFSTSNLNPGRVFTQTGRYTLTVEVQDRFGAFATAAKVVDILPPPQLALSSEINLTVTINQTATFPLLLGNAGTLPLTYTLTVADPQSMTYTLTDNLSTPGLYTADTCHPGCVYPGFIATAPPRPAEDEGHSGPIPLNFDFPFFGRVYTQVYGVVNGYLTFLPPYADLGVGTLPSGSVSLLWADYDMSRSGPGGYDLPESLQLSGRLMHGATGGGSWQYNNLAERGRLLFEYYSVVRAGYSYTDARSFQGLLYPDGAIKVQYSYITSTASLPAALRSPQGGNVISYTGTLTNQMAVLFRPIYGPVDWLSIEATSGSREAATTAPVNLTVDSAGLSVGNYYAWLLVRTNDPYRAYRIVRVSLAVADVPPTLIKTASDLTPTFGQRITYTLVVNNPGGPLADAVISDTLPSGLRSAGPGTIEGGTGTLGLPPALVTHLPLATGQTVTVTVPATVTAITGIITNTAQLGSAGLLAPVASSAAITVRGYGLFLPIIMKP